MSNPTPAQLSKLAFSVTEAAKCLGISRPHFYKLLHSGQIKSVKFGKRRIIPASEIDRILASLEEWQT